MIIHIKKRKKGLRNVYDGLCMKMYRYITQNMHSLARKKNLAIDIQNDHLLREDVQLYDEQYEIHDCHTLLSIVTGSLQVCSSIHFSGRFHFEHRIDNKYYSINTCPCSRNANTSKKCANYKIIVLYKITFDQSYFNILIQMNLT